MKKRLFAFDMGNVLISEENVWPALFRRFGIIVRNAREVGPNARKAVEEMCVGRMDVPAFWALVEKDIGHPVAWQGLLEDAHQCEEIPGTRSLIADVRNAGHRVLCATNTLAPFMAKIRRKGFYDLFDKVYTSVDLALAKPDPAFFLAIARAEGVDVSSLYFVDDREENLASAEKLGMTVHQFTTADELRHTLIAQGLLAS